MGHIFISYSHKDKSYVHKLQQELLDKCFETWIDDHIDYGTSWSREIEKRLRECDAFILVMSPNSRESEWVERELNLALKLKKPFFPLLLDGDEWFEVGATQFVDVKDGKLPDTKFFVRLTEVSPRKWSDESVKRGSPDPRPPAAPAQNISISINGDVQGNIVLGDGNQVQSDVKAIEKVIEKSEPATPKKAESVQTQISPPQGETKSPEKEPQLKPGYVIAIIGVAASLIAGLLGSSYIRQWFSPSLIPTTTSLPSIANQSSETNEKGAKMLLVPAGTFMMGSDNGGNDERPVHQITLDAFYIDQYEVTNALYKTCVDGGLCQPPKNMEHYDNSQYANHPVVDVNWNMAVTYCEWRKSRLPTEAEWEYAARSGDGRTYPWGEGIESGFANFDASDTAEVGTHGKDKSPFGIYDMAGNAREWILDWYAVGYYSTLGKSASNPLGPETGLYRVSRGGSWNFGGSDLLRSAKRGWADPVNWDSRLGFRCARSAVSP